MVQRTYQKDGGESASDISEGRSRLDKLADEVAEASDNRSHLQARGSRAVKFALLFFSMIATAAQFSPFGLAGWGAVGVASAMACLGLGALLLFTENDASTELATARRAIEAARAVAEDGGKYVLENDRFDMEVRRLAELHHALKLMREVAENTLLRPGQQVVEAVTLMMRAAQRSLLLSLGFDRFEHYTLCVYVAESDQVGKTELRAIAHIRTVDCPLEKARRWPIGVGVAGAALARGHEVVVPDVRASGVGSLYGAHLQKPADDERYVSIAAVPVLIGSNPAPWGIVCATSDRAGRFDTIATRTGVQTVEALRALAGMVALAVSATSRPANSASESLKVLAAVQAPVEPPALEKGPRQ